MYLGTVILQNLVLGTQILMVAVALSLVSAASRITHLAIGAIGAAAVYGVYWGIGAGWLLWVSILLGTCIACALGLCSAYLLEPFAVRRESLLGLLVSFGFGMILESVIAILFGTDGKNLQAGILPVVRLKNLELDLPGAITLGIGISLAMLTWMIVRFTGVGRLLRSVAENSALATSLGVRNKIVRRFAYGLAAVVAGLVVGLAGWHTALTPGMGFQLVIVAFVCLLMGGSYDLRGTIVASYAVVLIPGLIIGFTDGFSENWRLVFVFCVAAIVLAFYPHGVFAKQVRVS